MVCAGSDIIAPLLKVGNKVNDIMPIADVGLNCPVGPPIRDCVVEVYQQSAMVFLKNITRSVS